MIGRQGRPCMNLLVVLFPVVHGGDFQSPLLVVFLVWFRNVALGDFMGDVCVNRSWFFIL
jgi:hypothetical protein